MKRLLPWLAAVLAACGTSGTGPTDSGSGPPGNDSGTVADSGTAIDAGFDAGTTTRDSGAADSGTSWDAGTVDAGPFHLTPRSDWPVFENPSNHPVLSSIQLITITFSGYPFQSQVEAMGDFVVGSSWLQTIGRDYGVGTGTHLGKYNFSDYNASTPVTISDLDIEGLISNKQTSGALPPAGAQTLYLVYLPASVSLSNGSFGATCTNFLGYHNQNAGSILGGAAFLYAIVADCYPGHPDELSWIEQIASHEIAEAATDPFPVTQSSYVLRDLTNPWVAEGTIVEVGDVCEGQSIQVAGPDAGYTFQQIWSVSSVDAGLAPCVPIDPARPYFGVTVSPAVVTTADAGTTAQYQVTGWSSGPMAPWTIQTQPWAGFNGFTPVLTWNQPSLSNGQTATLGVSVPAGSAAGGSGFVMLYSNLPNSSIYSAWPVAVTAH